jgi:hypothetical protein
MTKIGYLIDKKILEGQ